MSASDPQQASLTAVERPALDRYNGYRFNELRIAAKQAIASARRDWSSLHRFLELVSEMREIAQSNERLSRPTPPTLPPRPPPPPELPELPCPPLYFAAKEHFEQRIGALNTKNKKLQLGSKQMRRKRSHVQHLQQLAAQELRRLRLNALLPDQHTAYREAQVAQQTAQKAMTRWEEEVAALRSVYERSLDGRSTHPANKISRIQGNIIDRLVKDYERPCDYGLDESPVGITRVNWRLLPPPEPGSAGLTKMLSDVSRSYPHLRLDEARLRFAYTLEPVRIYIGVGEFDGYLAFQFSWTPRTLLECPMEGNAAYIFQGNWAMLSRLSKTELLRGYGSQVVRVIHASESYWKSEIRSRLHDVPEKD